MMLNDKKQKHHYFTDTVPYHNDPSSRRGNNVRVHSKVIRIESIAGFNNILVPDISKPKRRNSQPSILQTGVMDYRENLHGMYEIKDIIKSPKRTNQLNIHTVHNFLLILLYVPQHVPLIFLHVP